VTNVSVIAADECRHLPTGLDPAIQIRRRMAQRNLDNRVSALRAGPAMTK
jgi:hypothetical protein